MTNVRLELCAFVAAQAAMPCSVAVSPEGEQIPRSDEIVLRAEAIVRARAAEYAVAPSDSALVTTGVPDSKIRFQVKEVIRGSMGKEFDFAGVPCGHG